MNRKTYKKKKNSVGTVAIRVDSLFKESDWSHVARSYRACPKSDTTQYFHW